MNQSIASDVSAVMKEVRSSGLLTSRCTITVPPEIYNEGGGVDPTAPYLPLAEHIDIPCTRPPLETSDTTRPSEAKSSTDIQSKTSLHVLLDNYYPAIENRFRALIDSIEYEIVNVESDSQNQMTRLAVQKVSI